MARALQILYLAIIVLLVLRGLSALNGDLKDIMGNEPADAIVAVLVLFLMFTTAGRAR